MKSKRTTRISAAALARLAGYAPGSITNFVKAGILTRGADGKLDSATSLEHIRQHELSRQQDGKHRTEGAKLRQLYLKRRIQLLEFEIGAAQGKVHDGQECCASLGELLSSVWGEIQALPSRAQSALPEVKALESTLLTLVNESADRLQDFFKAQTGKNFQKPRQQCHNPRKEKP